MTFQFLFFTISIERRKRSLEERLHDVHVQQQFDELKDREATFYRKL